MSPVRALYDAAQGLGVEERPIGEPRGDRYSAQYLLTDVETRGFRAGDDALEHLLRLELIRSFC